MSYISPNSDFVTDYHTLIDWLKADTFSYNLYMMRLNEGEEEWLVNVNITRKEPTFVGLVG